MKLKKPKSFVIDRRRWYRGKGSNQSMLRRPDGMQCCLGFYARACGVSAQKITDRYDPTDLLEVMNIELPALICRSVHLNTNTCDDMICTNDEEGLTEAKRESTLTKLFKRIGVKVRFTGGKKPK